jgi:AraC-like DNA-binding protein
MYELSVCLIAQGAKRVILGDEVLIYDAQHFLLTSVHLPTLVELTEASVAMPYLGLALKLNVSEIAQLIIDGQLPAQQTQPIHRGMATGTNTAPLINAFVRLLDALTHPQGQTVLVPMIQREIVYHLLMSEQGARLRQIAVLHSQAYHIAQTIDYLKTHFASPLRIDELALRAHMSPSTFHQHFRNLTAMSPLQYQKCLRLNEARRLMLSQHQDVSTAAFQVGYQSLSQFSREYSRMFGIPPSRDMSDLRATA